MGRLWCMKSEPAGEQKSNTTAATNAFSSRSAELEESGILEPCSLRFPEAVSACREGARLPMWALGFRIQLWN